MIYFDKKLSLFSFTLRTAEEIIIVNQMHKKNKKITKTQNSKTQLQKLRMQITNYILNFSRKS